MNRNNLSLFVILGLVLIFTQGCLLSYRPVNYTYINYPKKQAKRSLEKFIAKQKYVATISETDSTILYSVHDSTVKPVDEILYFNQNSILCYKEAEYYNCDSCLKKTIALILNNKKQDWIKISDSKYISRRRYILDIASNNATYSYVLKKEKMNKKDYNNLISGK